MANNRVQVKRTTVSGRAPNTTGSYATNSQYISAGELALNMTDGILYSSNGSAVIEIGANNTNVRVTGNLTVNSVVANGSVGSAGQVLYSNGSVAYWNAVSVVTSVDANAQYSWGNTQTFQNTITFSKTINIAANAVINSTAYYWVGNTTTSPTVTLANSGLFSIGNGSTTQTSGQILVQNTAGLTTVNAGSIQTTTAYANLIGSTANLSTSVNSALLTVGATFTANATLVNAAAINITGQVNTATLFATTSANLASSNVYVNTAGIFVTNTTGVVNAAVYQVGTSFTANATLVNAAAINITNQVNTATLYATTSANIGTAVIANSIGLTTTGFVNAATVVNSAAHTTGTAFIANTLGVYHTGTMNAASHTVGTTFTANATLVNAAAINITGQVNTATLYATTSANIGTAVIANSIGLTTTGFVNAATVVNSAAHTIGTTFIANTLGVYHTGTINAASHTIGTIFTVNTTQINISSIPLSANGSNGTSGQVLTSNGNVGAPYWSTPTASINVAAQYTWTNTQTFSNTITFSTNIWGNVVNATSYTTGGGFGSATGGVTVNTTVVGVGNSTINSYANSSSFTAEIGFSNRQNLDMGTFTTDATLNTLIVGPYTVSSGNSLVITTGSRVVIV